MIAHFDALEQVKRLASAGYGLSRDATAEGVARLWTETLEIKPEELRQAVSSYVKRGGRYFPRPGDLMDIVRDQRTQQGGKPGDLYATYMAWEQNHEGPCPVCGAVVQLVTASQRGDVSAGPDRLGMHHDWRIHRDKRVPHVGWPHARLLQPERGPTHTEYVSRAGETRIEPPPSSKRGAA